VVLKGTTRTLYVQFGPVVSLNEETPDKIRVYRPDSSFSNRPSNTISFIPVVTDTSGLLHCDLVLILFLQSHRD